MPAVRREPRGDGHNVQPVRSQDDQTPTMAQNPSNLFQQRQRSFDVFKNHVARHQIEAVVCEWQSGGASVHPQRQRTIVPQRRQIGINSDHDARARFQIGFNLGLPFHPPGREAPAATHIQPSRLAIQRLFEAVEIDSLRMASLNFIRAVHEHAAETQAVISSVKPVFDAALRAPLGDAKSQPAKRRRSRFNFAQAVQSKRAKQRRGGHQGVHRAIFVFADVIVKDKRSANLERLGNAADRRLRLAQVLADIHRRHEIESLARQWPLVQVYEFGSQTAPFEPPSRKLKHRLRNVSERDVESALRKEDRIRADAGAEIQVFARASPQRVIHQLHIRGVGFDIGRVPPDVLEEIASRATIKINDLIVCPARRGIPFALGFGDGVFTSAPRLLEADPEVFRQFAQAAGDEVGLAGQR